MESFVIEGGRPLTGTRPRRRATRTARCRSSPPACSPTSRSRSERPADPRRRHDARAARRPRRRRRVDRRRTRCASTPRASSKTELDEELSDRIRALVPARRAAARALRPRAASPPPGGDVIGRRRLDTHIHAFAAARRRGRRSAAASSCARDGPARQAHLPRRGERDGDRERRHGGRARARARP